MTQMLLAVAASLTGKQVSDFDAVQGALALNQRAGPGNDVDVLAPASVDLDGIYSPSWRRFGNKPPLNF